MAQEQLFNALRELEALRGFKSKAIGKIAQRIQDSLRIGIQDLKDYKGQEISNVQVEAQNSVVVYFSGMEELRIKFDREVAS